MRQRALATGLVSEVVPDAKLEEAAQPYIDDMLATSPIGLRMTKDGLNQAINALEPGSGDGDREPQPADVRAIARFRRGPARVPREAAPDLLERVTWQDGRRCGIVGARNKETRTPRERAMKLTPQQIESFHREGWLFLPELFSEEEVAVLRHEAVSIYDSKRPEVWCETSGAPRTAFAAHTYNEAFRLLGAHPRLIEPVEQLLGETALHASVQDQREGGVRRRGLAVAPGLRHLEARRRHAGAARHEHSRLPRRGHAHQRAADADPRAASTRATSRPRTTRRPPRIRCGRWTRPRSRGWSPKAASSRRSASPAAS